MLILFRKKLIWLFLVIFSFDGALCYAENILKAPQGTNEKEKIFLNSSSIDPTNGNNGDSHGPVTPPPGCVDPEYLDQVANGWQQYDNDPDYVQTTLDNRKFHITINKLTPFDNFLIKIKIAYCKLRGDPPPAPALWLPFAPEIVADGKVVLQGAPALSFKRVDYNETSATYAWPIKGWDTGMTSGTREFINNTVVDRSQEENLAILNRYISSHPGNMGENLTLRLYNMPAPTESPRSRDFKLPPLHPCVQIWGPDESNNLPRNRATTYKFVYAYGKSVEEWQNTPEARKKSMAAAHLSDIYKKFAPALIELEPFKTHKNSLGFFLDLYVHDDFREPTSNVFGIPKFGDSNFPARVSRCGGATVNYFLHEHPDVYQGGYAAFTSSAVIVRAGHASPTVMNHEAGHAFCGLIDEYVPLPGIGGVFASPFLHRNCSLLPEQGFKGYDGILYGQTNLEGCTSSINNRSTFNSLMTDNEYNLGAYKNDSTKLNVVSCARCEAKFHNSSDQKRYYSWCNSLPAGEVVKKDDFSCTSNDDCVIYEDRERCWGTYICSQDKQCIAAAIDTPCFCINENSGRRYVGTVYSYIGLNNQFCMDKNDTPCSSDLDCVNSLYKTCNLLYHVCQPNLS